MATNNFNPLDYGAKPVSFNPTSLGASPVSTSDPLNGFSQMDFYGGVTNPLGKAVIGFGRAAKETTDALTGNSGTVLDLVNPIGYAAKGVSAATEALGAGVNAVAQNTFPWIGKALRYAVGAHNADQVSQALNSLGNSDLAKQLVATYSSPDVTQGLSAVQNVANLAGTMAMAKGGIEGLGELTKPGSLIGDTLINKYTASEKTAWEKPALESRATYNKPTQIFKTAAEKGNNIPQTLVDNGIRLSDNVSGGNYSTADTADALRTDAGKASSELLRPALQQADSSPNTPRIAVRDIVEKVKRDISASQNITPSAKEAQIAKAESEGAALARKYPNGMGLTDLHDTKITYNQNGGFSPVNDPTVNNIASVNRAFGRSLASTLEENAPPGIPVKEFNAELQKQYQAADYLDSLNNKKVPMSAMAKVRNYVGKLAGLGIANQAIPGVNGILADVAGYHIGGMVESLLENLSSPMRSILLSNLEKSNPVAFEAIKNYMTSGAPLILSLPPGKAGMPRSSVETPISTVPPTTYEPPAKQISYSTRKK